MLYFINGVYLLICAFTDHKGKWISLPLSMMCLVMAVIIRIVIEGKNGISATTIIPDILVGIVCIIIANLPGNPLGTGDGLMLTVGGLCIGAWLNVVVACLGFLMGGIYGIVRHSCRLPLAPFLLIAYMGVIVILFI